MKMSWLKRAGTPRILLASTLLAFSCMAPLANAQGGLEEVVVTAQKREQSIQDVPIAVTALTQEALLVNNIMDVNDLNGLAPNLTVRPAVGGVQVPAFNIRGITSYGVVPGSDKQVSTYLDGVYIGAARGGIFTLPDIERLEVLRGPQGTLFGRNATGGAINVVTRDPTGELGFRQKLGFGNRDYFQSQTTVDLPAWGPFSAYFTYAVEEADGDIDNLGAGTTWDRTAWGQGFDKSPKTLGELDNENFFLAARLDYDKVVVSYKFDYFKDEGSPRGNALVTEVCGECLGIPGFDSLLNGLADINSDLLGTGEQTRPDKVNNAWSTYRDQENTGHNLTIDWEISDSLTLKNILAYRDAEQYQPADITATSGWLAGYIGPLIPPAPLGGPFTEDTPFCYVCSYVLYEGDHWSNELQLNYSSDFVELTTGAIYYESEDDVDGNTFQFAFLPDYVVPGDTRYTTHNEAESYALFTQAEFHLTQAFDLVAGFRYTKDDKSGTGVRVTGGVVTRDFEFDYDDDNVSYLLGVNYRPTDDVLLYAKYSTGFVSGGAVGEFEFEPEEVESWEIGSKADFFDSRLRANLALFDATYDDLQTAQSGSNVPGAEGISTLVVTGGKLEAQGMELELSWLPLDSLVLSGSLGYQDVEFAEVTELVASTVGAAGPNAYPNSDFLPTLTPEWNASLAANYTTDPLFGDAYLTLGITGIWTDEQRIDANPGRAAATPFGVAEFIPSTWVVNTRAALKSIRLGESWEAEVGLWGRNLTDEDEITFITNFGAMVSGTFMDERSYGVDLIVRYN